MIKNRPDRFVRFERNRTFSLPPVNQESVGCFGSAWVSPTKLKTSSKGVGNRVQWIAGSRQGAMDRWQWTARGYNGSLAVDKVASQ